MNSPVYELAERYVERFAALDPLAATGEGIAGHDHEMTDYSPDGAAERAEHDRATLARARHRRRRQRRRPDRGRGDARAARARRSTQYDAGERLRDLRVLGSPVQTVRSGLRPHGPRHRPTTGRSSPSAWRCVPQGALEHRGRARRGRGRRASWRRGARRVACAQQADTWGGRRRRDAAVLPHARRRVRRVGTRRPRLPRPPRARWRRAPPRRTRRSGGSSSTSTRRTPTSAIPSGASATRCSRRTSTASSSTSTRPTRGAGRSCTASRTRCGQVAERILPGADVDAVIEHLETDPTRAIEGVDEFQRWNQELHRPHRSPSSTARTSTSPEPLRRCEAMIAPPGGAAAMYYTGPTEDFSRPGRTWYPTLGKTRFPLWGEVSICYHEGVPGHHLQVAQVRYLADAAAAATSARSRVRLGPRRGLGAVRRAAHGRARLPRGPAYELGHAARRRRCARCASSSTSACTSSCAIPADERYHPGETWTPELALPFVIERSRSSRADFMAQRGRPLPRAARPGDQLQGRRAGVARAPAPTPSAAHGRRVRPEGVPPRTRSTSGRMGLGPARPGARPPLRGVLSASGHGVIVVTVSRPRGEPVKRVSIVAIVVLIAAAMVSVGGVAANAQSNEAPKATEVGVTADHDPHRGRRRRRQPVRTGAVPVGGGFGARRGQVHQRQRRHRRAQGAGRLHRLAPQPQRLAQRDHHRVPAGLRARRHRGAVPLEHGRRDQLQGHQRPGHGPARPVRDHDRHPGDVRAGHVLAHRSAAPVRHQGPAPADLPGQPGRHDVLQEELRQQDPRRVRAAQRHPGRQPGRRGAAGDRGAERHQDRRVHDRVRP